MSNRAYIQQQTVIVHKTKKSSKSVAVFDDYGQGSICLDVYCDEFYSNDMELLAFVLEAIKDGGLGAVNDVLDSVYGNKTGLYIEDTWYDWSQIEPVFEKSMDK